MYIVCFLLGNSPASEFYLPTFRNTLFHLHRQVYTYLPMKMKQCVPKRPHIKFRGRGITQKKTYNILDKLPMKWCCATVTDDDRCMRRLQVQSVTTNTSTRQVMYVQRNSKARSCNHCCSGEVVSITHYECVFVSLGTQHTMRMSHNGICGLPRSTIFFRFIS